MARSEEESQPHGNAAKLDSSSMMKVLKRGAEGNGHERVFPSFCVRWMSNEGKGPSSSECFGIASWMRSQEPK